MIDVTTLNPHQRIDQLTAFVLVPSCVRCGHQGFSLRRDGAHRCDGCQRGVTSLEFAPSVLKIPPVVRGNTEGD